MSVSVKRLLVMALCSVVLSLVMAATGASHAQAGQAIGVLAVDSSADKLGPEATAAWQLAQKLGPASLVFVTGNGKFADAQGKPVALDAFPVIWFHQGDAVDPSGPIHGSASIQSLRKHVADGRGLMLSGAALAMVRTLGIEPVQPRRGSGGRGPFAAGLIPVETNHPVFEGLTSSSFIDEKRFPINDEGFPAFADFFGTGGPAGGMLLARATAGAENPLVEYALGKGRVIALGWRLPRYDHPANPHRANLERLTGNILAYLGQQKQWVEVVVKIQPRAVAAAPGVPAGQWRSLELAIRDLAETFKDRYPKGGEYLKRLEALKPAHDRLLAAGTLDKERLAQLDKLAEEFRRLRTEALLANPLVDFDRLLLVERGAGNLGLPANWESNSSLRTTGYDNRLCVLLPVHPEGKLTTLFEPPGDRFIGDVKLHWSADRMLFSMPGAGGRWQVHEMTADGKSLRELSLVRQPDVDNYDACYLPDGRILFTSTAPFVGVPCVYGSSHVTNLYIREHDGSIRQLTVDQEHNWCPAVLNNGRVLYLRWEYTDLPHSNSRRLFHMNPDGTSQMEYFGSNSYFVNSFFYAKPIPGHPTKVVGIATGHHGNARTGRMLIFDPARGRREADGVVQEIPGYGKKVEPIIRDNLADGVWPQFLHPYPVSEKHFLVSCKPSPEALWGIYLVDVFDNMLLLVEKPGYAMLEPVPLRKTPVPPVLPDRVDPRRKDALVYMNDVYTGGGLRGIPRGTVKSLRLVGYHFSYQGMGGLLGAIGMDGPWDIKRVVGTVPVEPDGSALFRIPAYTPIAVQPLDSEGKALQLMRSWFTAMPGEVLSCVGCHEQQNTGAVNRQTIAARRTPSEVTPWHGPVRGFSFPREVQPVLDRYCVGCHNGQKQADAPEIADLRGDRILADWNSDIAGHVSPAVGGKFSVAYAELHRFVRRPGIEDDIHMLAPMEYHADSTELVQLLRKGHYDVRLDPESWDRLVTWIDLNAPYHGTWTEIAGRRQVEPVAARARAMRKLFTGMEDDFEAIFPSGGWRLNEAKPQQTAGLGQRSALPQPPHAPLPQPPQAAAQQRLPSPVSGEGPGVRGRGAQNAKLLLDGRPAPAGKQPVPAELARRTIDLGGGVKLELVRIPAGQFVIGDPAGEPDQQPPTPVAIQKPFWIGRCEVTNAEFARFDPAHDSHVEPMHGYQFGIHGYPASGPRQPVVRVSWQKAIDFCRWLSRATGQRFDLPTEAQWEYACRAGTSTPFSYGTLETDFSAWANLGDLKLREFALDTYIQVRVIPNPNKYDDWVPKDERFNDAGFVSVDVGSYKPNPWGLHDVHGNVWEWTRSAYRPYPYRDDDGRNDPAADGPRVVRGGSWYDRPKRCTSSYRLPYRPYQGVFNVGFRVVMEE